MQRLSMIVRLSALVLILAVWTAVGIGVSGALASETGNPCALLTPAEVEAVLGEPLAGPPFRASNGLPAADGDVCRYQTAAFRAVDLSVNWSDGGRTFGLMDMVGGIVADGGLKGAVTLSSGTTVSGSWDAARDFLCCQFNALRGERLVSVDIGASRASLEQAAALTDLAVQRLDQPLGVDDAAGLASALERDKTRPAAGPACALVTRPEAEAIVGAPLSDDPQGDNSSCQYSWSPVGADYTEQLTLNVTWRDGLSEMRQTQAAMGQALSFMNAEGLAADQAQHGGDGLFDEQASSFIGVMAVRKDVLLNIETGGMNNDPASAFIATAASKL